MSAAFEGSLRLIGSNDSLSAVVSLAAGEMTITAGGHQIGQWDVDELTVTRQPDGFRIRVEDEELAVSLKNPAAFAEAVGITDTQRPRGQKRGIAVKRKPRARVRKAQPKDPKPKAKDPKPKLKEPRPPRSEAPTDGERRQSSLRSRFARLPLLARVAIIALPFLIAFAVVATFTFAAVMVLAGMLALIVGGFALSDDPTVYMLDARIPEWSLPLSGIVLIVGGLALMVVL